MRDLPHLVYLQAFEAAARHQSFTRAAAELNCTQAAISQRIRGLEQYFGRPLFHRKANGLELSSAGKAYLPGITQALDVMAAATRGLSGRREARTLTVSAPISFLNLCLVPQLAEFMEAAPDVALQLNSAIWTDPNVDLADVSILFVDRQQAPLGAIELCPAPVTLVSPSAGRAGQARAIEVQGRTPLWTLWADRSGAVFEADLPACRVDTAETALHLVREGFGHTVIYALYARAFLAPDDPDGLRQGGLVATGQSLMMVPNGTRKPGSAARDFMDWLARRMTGSGT
ncbi:LysR family transcriptional regulator [Antarctobacter sp.]|uniref:LysR family transcriptional regulator n=1 Tax=Antarctobacter sp. TaxID=1872577 RepID=UPI003A8F52A0